MFERMKGKKEPKFQRKPKPPKASPVSTSVEANSMVPWVEQIGKGKATDAPIILGIDPGMSGAVSAFDGGNLKLYWVRDFKDGEKIICDAIHAIMNYFDRPVIAALEKVHAIPPKKLKGGKVGISAPASFNFGKYFGWWQGFLMGRNIPFIEIPPQAWQKGFVPDNLKGEKNKTRRKAHLAREAVKIFPAAPVYGPKGGVRDGRSDSLLIGYNLYTMKAHK